MVMGDLVLLESEINPVMLKLMEGGIDITAVHNHLLRASPATFYMHVGGHGDPVKMATAIRDALGASQTPLATPAPAGPPPAIDLDTAQLDQIIGAKGQAAFPGARAQANPPPPTPAPAGPPPAIDLDTAQFDQIIGAKGQANGGVYQIGVPRRDPVTDNGVQIAPAGPMGVATAITFQPTGGGKAHTPGDF